jgi:hypothetical protein
VIGSPISFTPMISMSTAMFTALFSASQFFSRSRSGPGPVAEREVDDDGRRQAKRGDQATACLPPAIPVWAIAVVPATMRSRFFGLRVERSTPAPPAGQTYSAILLGA